MGLYSKDNKLKSQSDMDRCYLLELPVEVRCMIYEFFCNIWTPRPSDYNADTDPFRASILHVYPCADTSLPGSEWNRLPYTLDNDIVGWAYIETYFEGAILETCKRIHEEATDILYRQIKLHVRFNTQETFERTIKALTNSPFRYVKSLDFSISIPRLLTLSKQCFRSLRQILEAMPYVHDVSNSTVDFYTTPEERIMVNAITLESFVEATWRLNQLNEGETRFLSSVYVPGFLSQERTPAKLELCSELESFGIEVKNVTRMRDEVRYRLLYRRHANLYLRPNQETLQKIRKFSLSGRFACPRNIY